LHLQPQSDSQTVQYYKRQKEKTSLQVLEDAEAYCMDKIHNILGQHAGYAMIISIL